VRRLLCLIPLLALSATDAAAQQDTVPSRPDSAAVADSIAIVRELEGMQAGRDTSPSVGPAGPVQRMLPDISVVGGDLGPE
jgi:hypothetical protein